MKSYNKTFHSKRRKPGGQPGSHNASGLLKLLEQARGDESAGSGEADRESESGDEWEEDWTEDVLEQEIKMLRRAMRNLDRASEQATSIGDKIKVAQMLSLVGERLATMLVAQKKLGGGESEFHKVVKQALLAATQELGIVDEFGNEIRG